MRSVLSQFTVLNLLLLSLIVLLSFRLYGVYTFVDTNDYQQFENSQKDKADQTEAEDTIAQSDSKVTQQITQHLTITENNLFHPERRIPTEKKVVQELPKPEIVLYGTMVSGDSSIAFIEDLKAQFSTQGRGKRQRAIKKGDTISGFVVKEIEQDRITLVRGEETMTVSVNDPTRKKPRAVATTSVKTSTIIPPAQAQQQTPNPPINPTQPSPQPPPPTPKPEKAPSEGFNPLLDMMRRSR